MSIGAREREWLDRSWDELAEIATGLELRPEDRRLMEIRWLGEARHYEEIWRRQRRWHDALGVLTIVAGLTAPLLVGLAAPDWTLALSGFVVAASSALDGYFRYGERWRHQRSTAMLLKAEGIRFLELRPPYARRGTHLAAFSEFIERLERLNEAQSEEYLALLSLAGNAPAPPPGAEPG